MQWQDRNPGEEADDMAAKPKFNANRPRPKLTAAAVRKVRTGGKKGGGGKGSRGNAWRAYVGTSNEPLPW
jgi:hypothetical protein